MSKPTRYNVKCGDEGYAIVESLGGEWVRHGDYARLKDEFERLGAFKTNTIIPNKELQAQVKRLTKAGDNMYSWLGVCGRHNNSTGDNWLRAKKGLPSLTEQWEIEKRNRAAENAAKEGATK